MLEQIHGQTYTLMSEMKKMNEAILEMRERKKTPTEHVHSPSLESDVRKLNQSVNELAKRNEAVENLILKMTEEKRSHRTHI
jgi:uncharacterized protein YlxW (UPF0749 family)